MTKKRDLLLQEIWKEPLDDAPRFVYSDLLEQEDELERANFIRLQVGRAALPWWDPRVLELELEERAILAKHEAEWRAALPQLDGVQWGPFSRGFVGKVAFDSVELFDKHRAECLAATPVHSIAMPWPDSRGAKQEPIEGLRELTLLGAVMRPEDMRWLATNPLLSTVRSLNLIDSELYSGLPHLLKSPHMAGLEALRIPQHVLGNAGVKKLLAAKLPKLAILDLSAGSVEQLGGSGGRAPGASVNSRIALEVAAWRGLSQIRSLDISGSKLGREALSTVLMSPYTKALTSLRVRKIADAEWEMDDSLAAFQAGPAGALEELDVSDNDLDPDAARALAESRALQELKVLHIANVRSKSFERLAQAPWIHSLRVLSCGESALEPILARKPKHLHTIKVVAEGSAARGLVKRLTAVPLPAVTTLDLGRSRITDEGLRLLGNVDTLPNLASVTLRHERSVFTPEGAAEFAGSPLGKQLKSLDTGILELDRLPPAELVDIGDGEYDGPFRFL